MWRVVYKKSVKKDLKHISQEVQKVIRKSIENKLMIDPLHFGKPLRKNLNGLMKLRVRDYRIIYSIDKQVVTVYVIKNWTQKRSVYLSSNHQSLARESDLSQKNHQYLYKAQACFGFSL